MKLAAFRACLLPALMFASGISGCGSAHAREPSIRVFAAASLSEVFEELTAAFEAQNPGARVQLHCAGTPRLVIQLREGAAADVLAAADMANLQRVSGADDARVFARNRLAIVVGEGNPEGLRGPADLARADLKLALCGQDVPAGRYARAFLERAGIRVRSVSDEPNVKALLTKVRLGELDAGIVYVTDVRAAEAQVDGIELDFPAAYPITTLSAGANFAGGEAFVDFVLSPAGQRVLRAAGFLTP